MRKLIQGHTGVLKEGEMLLVLGRPGSGCSTFLKAVSSSLPSNIGLHPNSQISYAGLPPSEIMGELRGEVIYSSEDDIHSPTLSVADTLRFALRSKVPTRDKRLEDESRFQFVEKFVILLLFLAGHFVWLTYFYSTLDAILKTLGISHVRDSIVGDAYKRFVCLENVFILHVLMRCSIIEVFPGVSVNECRSPRFLRLALPSHAGITRLEASMPIQPSNMCVRLDS
jgi:energy-coupling factor transporter ATP-binding protein EcfA2